MEEAKKQSGPNMRRREPKKTLHHNGMVFSQRIRGLLPRYNIADDAKSIWMQVQKRKQEILQTREHHTLDAVVVAISGKLHSTHSSPLSSSSTTCMNYGCQR